MNINDLTVNISQLDRRSLLSEWRWLIDASKLAVIRLVSNPSKLPILVTAGGDVFVQDVKNMTVHFLDATLGTVSPVCSSEQELRASIFDKEFVKKYFSVEMVNELRQSGHLLQSNQIYSFKLPPVLGGKRELSNVEVTDIQVHFSIYGQIHRQVAKLPAGAPISDVRIK